MTQQEKEAEILEFENERMKLFFRYYGFSSNEIRDLIINGNVYTYDRVVKIFAGKDVFNNKIRVVNK